MRCGIAGLLLCLSAGLGMAQTEPAAIPGKSLRAAAQMRGLTIGASVDEDALRGDAEYAALLGREFGMLTPENVMKFDSIHPAPFRYNFADGDRILGFATEHGMQVHGHVLVWHAQLPAWLTRTKWTREELRLILHAHIARVVGHYRQRVPVWDVVSEAIDDRGELRKTFWLEGIGPEYIALAFQWAHEADPDAHLIYNDYSMEGLNRKADAVLRLLADLRARGVPVHGVGFQMHLNVEEPVDPAEVQVNIQRFAKLGLKTHITEMDVSVPMPVSLDKLALQAGIYRDMMKVCLSVSDCKSFALWGFTDRYSWIPAFFPGRGAALIFDAQLQPKPAYDALIGTLNAR